MRVKKAQQQFANFTQDQVDKIFRAAALAAADSRIPLAKLAVEESGMGIIEDKVIKIILLRNIFIMLIKMRKLVAFCPKILLLVLSPLPNLLA